MADDQASQQPVVPQFNEPFVGPFGWEAYEVLSHLLRTEADGSQVWEATIQYRQASGGER